MFDTRTKMKTSAVLTDTGKADLFTHARYSDHHLLLGYGDGEIKQLDMRRPAEQSVAETLSATLPKAAVWMRIKLSYTWMVLSPLLQGAECGRSVRRGNWWDGVQRNGSSFRGERLHRVGGITCSHRRPLPQATLLFTSRLLF